MNPGTKQNALFRPIYYRPLVISLMCAGIVNTSSPAQAFTINAIFDSTVTSLSNTATVQAAFNAAAATYASLLSDPVTINIKVGWGSINGQAMPSGAAGASQTAMTGYWTYPQMRSYLASPSVSLPATQPGPALFAMARAEAKALGLISATSTIADGAVGFNSSLKYDFNQTDGITSGTYDFTAIAEHEIAEVLGRASSITPNGTTFYQTPLDLFRYSAPGVQSYSYTGASYFSLDLGVTNLGWWNNSSGGDRADWLTGSSGSYPNDVQNAYISTGATSLAPADMAMLAAIGWTGIGGTQVGSAGTVGTVRGISGIGGPNSSMGLPIGNDDIDTWAIAMPEPATLMMMTIGLAGLVLVRRARV